MEWLWIVFVPLTAISVLALVGHATFMRAMMPQPVPDISTIDRHAARNREMDAPRINTQAIFYETDPSRLSTNTHQKP